MKKIILSFGLIGMLGAGQTFAGDKEILATLQKLEIPKEGVKIFPTSLPNINVVMTEQGIFYVSNDGRFFSQGPIFDMKSGVPQALTSKIIKSAISEVSRDAISFKAEKEKYVVTVFTDITCSYCKKFHEQIADYNKLGITINYLAFPRRGSDSEAGKQMQSIWSAVDRKKAFDEGYNGKSIPQINGMVAYVSHHFNVGKRIGITGTPTIVSSNGEIIGGYLPPKQLKEILNHSH